ncbi:hypothetical protein Zmor_010263 [Zophobas morio]|uniref:Uncharacterized protein n=1 Tax=Zophobas morio TaxID=2755281 RepID=A0AA38ISA7_9CUCU|nr:hypothetical protein Zmor_010263 [Zophobas morio]
MYTVGRTQRPFRYELPPYRLLPPSFVGKSCGRIRGGEKSGTAVPLVFVTPLCRLSGTSREVWRPEEFLRSPQWGFSFFFQKKLVTRHVEEEKKVVEKNRKETENLAVSVQRKTWFIRDLARVTYLRFSRSLTRTPGVTFPGCRSPKSYNPLFCASAADRYSIRFLTTIPSDELRKFPIRRPIAFSLLKTPLVHRSLSLAPDSLLSRQPLIFEP